MTPAKCVLNECIRKRAAFGFCHPHYLQMRRGEVPGVLPGRGRPGVPQPMSQETRERIRETVRVKMGRGGRFTYFDPRTMRIPFKLAEALQRSGPLAQYVEVA